MKRILLLLLLFLPVTFLLGQQPPGSCPGNQTTLSNTCADACVLCDFQVFSSSNNTSSAGQQVPNNFCPGQPIQPHNVQWVGFVAATPNITMEVVVSNCVVTGQGLQIGIWGTSDCASFNLVSNCAYEVPPNVPMNFMMSGLTVGGTYFFVVDGFNDDVCDFTVTVTAGSTTAPPVTGTPVIQAPSSVCPGGILNLSVTGISGAGIFEWTVNGNVVGYNPTLTYTAPPVGTTLNICVTPSNPCNDGTQTCTTIQVQPLPPVLLNPTICEGQTFTHAGQSFSTPGLHTLTQTTPEGCIEPVHINLTVVPPVYTNESAEICQGEVYWVGTPGQQGSQLFTFSGQYQVLLPSSVGCDSIVTLDLTVHPNYFNVVNEDICEGESIIVTDGIVSYTHNQTGIYEHTLTTSEGCDSLVILVLNVFPEPPPVYVQETVCPGGGIWIGDFLYYNTTGIYSAVLESAGGCDSLVTVNLTVLPPNINNLTEEICNGESFQVGNSTFTTSGNYQRILTSSAGCDSTVNLALTVLPPIETFLTIDICPGESYSVGNSTYTTSGAYQNQFLSAIGCDSIVYLDLTVSPEIMTDLEEVICAGASFSVGNSTYDNSGSYQDLLVAANGCDSTVFLNLTILAPIETFLTEDICDGDSYSVGSSSYNASGNYSDILTAANGCDSAVYLNLTVLDIPETNLTASICDGESYQVGNSVYSAEGSYTDLLTAATGCDSIVYLDLSVISAFETYLDVEICTGQTYTVGSSTYSSGGSYTDLLTASIGCDSFVYLNLTISDVLEDFVAIEICEGESYMVGSSTYSQTGSYQDPFITSEGCDSILYLELTVHPIPETFLVESICDGESFTVGGSSFTSGGSYVETLISDVTGCDSIVHLDLTVLDVPQTFLVESICDGETYAVGNSTYSSAGSYQDILTAANGCDSTVFLDLTILDVPETFLTESICDGETYPVGNSAYTSDGSYQNVLTAANGCDSIVFLDLTVLDVPTTSLTQLICDGESFQVGNSSFTATGIYTETLTAANGCDSIVMLDLTVAPIQVTDIVTSICEGSTYSVGASAYTATGSYQDILTSSVGCDSIVNLELTVTDFYQTYLDESICDGESYIVGSSTYTTSGNFQDMFIAQDGCDSIVNLALTVFDIPVTNLSANICDGESYSVGNSTYTVSGNFQDILTAETGCDSIVNLALTVDPVFETNLIEAICDGESFSVGASVYSVSGSYQDLLTAANGCDSLVNLDLTVNEIPETFLDETLCFGETFTVGNATFTATGTYTEVLTAVTGCDSIVHLNLNIPNQIVTTLSETLCFGESYTVGNSTYSASGQYQDVLTAANGCDSVVTLSLVVRDLIETHLVGEICDGEVYSVGNSSYTAGGVYLEVLTSVTGCDSIVQLDLTVFSIPQTDLVESICQGESFTVGNSTYTSGGTYQDVLTAQTGCDSIVLLNLTVFPIPQTTLTESICEGETFSVGNSTYTSSGSYQDVLAAYTGCDSIVFLNLTVIDIPETYLDEAICEGAAFSVGNSTYTSSGAYQDVLTAHTGCDSIVYLNLTVNEVYEVNLVEAICDGDSYSVGGTNFTQTGFFQERLTSVAGCDSLVNLTLTVYPCELTLALDTGPVGCHGDSDGSISFELTVGTPPYVYTWEALGNGLSGSGNISNNNVEALIEGLPAGNYRITITDSYDITEIVVVTVEQPTPVVVSLSVSDYSGYNTSCESEADGFITPTAGGGTAPYTFTWSNGSQQSNLNNLAPGNYMLTVTDRNGCIAVAEAFLSSPPPLSAEVSAADPICFGDREGIIEITSVSGGVGPYLYALNNQAFSPTPLFPGLGIGVYTVLVQDANGCIWERSATVNQPQELIVDLGEDIRISLGESVDLLAMTSYPVQDYIWKSGDTLSCENCPDPSVRPFATTTYTVTVMDQNGCTDTDEITVFVAKDRDVFIPNVFSPNDDGFNDIFLIHGGQDVASIKSFYIFNRWGETMYQLFNFTPNDPVYGWDGTHRGQRLNSGAYVYFAEIEFIDGEVLLYKGDVVLMR
jgi:gliding motility-associated-like protein